MHGHKACFRVALVCGLLCLMAQAWGEDQDLPAAGAGVDWTVYEGSEFPGAQGELHCTGEGLVRLAYDFSEGGAYVSANAALAEPVYMKALRFDVRKPRTAQVTLRVTDATGQTLQKTVYYDSGDWQTLRAPLDGWRGHWGGANDGVVHGPISALGFLIEAAGISPKQGEMRIRNIVLETCTAEELAQLRPAEDTASYLVTRFGSDAGFGGEGMYRAGEAWEADLASRESATVHHSLSLHGRPERLLLRMRGPKGAHVSLQLGSHFQSFGRMLGVLDGTEQVFDVPVPPDAGWEHWGGEADNVVRHPLRLTRLTIARGDAPAAKAEVYLRDLRCTTKMDPREPVVLHARLQEGADGQHVAAITGTNLTSKPLEGTLHIVLRNWDGETVSEAEPRTWELPAGDTAEQVLPVTLPAQLHFAEAMIGFEHEGRTQGQCTATWTAGPANEGDAGLSPDSIWGMGLYLYRYPGSPEGLAEMDHAAAMAQAAGVKWTREEMSWERMEPRPGELDFGFYDAVVDTAERHGISIYGLLAYWAPHVEPYTLEGIDAFCAWASQVVRRYKDRVHHWEIYNEPNIFFWSGPKELYPVLLKQAYRTIKEEDPTAQVLGLSTAGIDFGFIEQVQAAGAPFDALTVHPYRHRLEEAGLIGELQRAAAMTGGKDVWITEMGWNTAVSQIAWTGGMAAGTSERAQATLLARSYLAAAASGVVRSMSWYDFRCDGDDPFYNEHNFGVVRRDMTPKPTYRALMSVCRGLAGSTLTPVSVEGPAYAVGSRETLAVWPKAGGAEVQVPVKNGAKAANLMGEPVPATVRDGQLTLSLRPGDVLFVQGYTGGPVRAAEAALPSAGPPLPAVITF